MQQEAPKGTRIAHIGIAVKSISATLPFLTDILGLERAEISDSDGAKIAAVIAGDSLVELLEPDGDDTPIGKFIAEGKRIAFLHPSSTEGILVELSEY